MEKLIVNGVEFNNFGTNKFSMGMQLITAYPMPDGIVEDVLKGNYPGIFLNPSAPCENEFFGVYGTPEQYKEFYNKQRKACISSQILEEIDWDFSDPRYEEIADRIKNDYRDWWDK